MIDLTKIDVLLSIGFIAAIVAIGGGIRGVYSVAATSRRERTNQATTPFGQPATSRKRKETALPTEKRRKAA